MPMDIERRTAYELREPELSVNGLEIVGAVVTIVQIEGDGAMLISQKEGDKEAEVIYLRAEALDAVIEARNNWQAERSERKGRDGGNDYLDVM